MRYFLLSIILFSCSTLKQDIKNVDKAAVRHPEILAKKARDLFPCVTSKGDTIWISDSAAYNQVLLELQTDNFNMSVARDSMYNELSKIKEDTTCFALVDLYTKIIGNLKADIINKDKKIKNLPPIIVTKTIVDTVLDKAALETCEVERRTTLTLLQKKTTESDEWHGKAKKRYYIMWGLILLLATIIGWKVYNMFKPKLKSL